MSPAVAHHATSGWQARLKLGFRVGGQRTVLAHRQRCGPLAVQRAFYPEGPVCHAYLLHPPGGVVGGDSLNVDVDMGSGAHALVTSPGATKFYRSAAQRASLVQRLEVAAGAALEWLPQENIFFPGAVVSLDTRVTLHGDARLALWEMHCLGRPAIAEDFDEGRLDSRLTVYRDQRPLLFERLRLAADNRQRLAQMAGRPVSGSLLITPADGGARDAARKLLPADNTGHAAATLIGDLLLVRYLGSSTEQARGLFSAVWQRLRPNAIGREASPPRIWAT